MRRLSPETTVKGLGKDEQVRELLEQASAAVPALIGEIIALCEIPAPTFEERARAEYVRRRFEAIGLEAVEVDEMWNCTGVLRGSGEGSAVLVAAHQDTVFPAGTDVTVRTDGERLHAPGVGDNCSNLAGMIRLAALLAASPVRPHCDIVFAATVREEGLGDLGGMKEVIRRWRDRISCVIVLDGGLGGLVHEAVASRRYAVTCRSEGGHSWGAFGSPSAIHGLAALIVQVCRLHVPRVPRTTYNFGVIHGGTSVNTIAQSATAQLDLRSLDMKALSALEESVFALARKVATAERVTFQFELIGDRPGGRLSATSPLVRTVKAVHRALGIETRAQALSTDANIPLSLGIPSVGIGITVGANGHRTDEYIETAPLPSGMRQIVLVTLSAAGTGQYAPAC